MILKHLPEWISSTHSLEVVEGYLACDTLALGHTDLSWLSIYDLSILLSSSWMLSDCLPDVAPSLGM